MRIGSESFLQRVRKHLDSLPVTERQLADFVLEFPGELASYAGNELAQLAGVSPSTVSRFIRRIGYANYEDARKQVRGAGGQACCHSLNPTRAFVLLRVFCADRRASHRRLKTM